MYRKTGTALVLFFMIAYMLCGCDNQTTQGGGQTQPPQPPIAGAKQGQAHGYIAGAWETILNDTGDYVLDAVRFIDDHNMLIVKCDQTSSQTDFRMYYFDTQKNQIRDLPDVLKHADGYSYRGKLDNGDLFFKLTSYWENEGMGNDYVVIDATTLQVKKMIDAPNGVDYNISISPDGQHLVYQKDGSLYVSDLDFSNSKCIIQGKINQMDETKNEIPKDGVFLGGNQVLYRWMGWEWTLYCAVVDLDGSNIKQLKNTIETMLYQTQVKDKYFYMDNYDTEYGIYDAITGSKKKIYADPNGVVGYAYDNKLTCFAASGFADLKQFGGARMEIFRLSDSQRIANFEKGDATMYPVSLSMTPSGSKLAFLDRADAQGPWKLYVLDISALA